MKNRGAALAVVLALISVFLIIGLAMGSLSTLSLQFNRRQVEGIRAEMAARSALANLIAKLHTEDVENGIDPLDPQPYRVVDRVGQRLSHQEGAYTVDIHLTQDEGYSSDNLYGDAPMVGWPDLDDEVPRIPPFTLDLILNVKGPAYTARYRVGIRRIWPYALYTQLGPITLMGNPPSGEDSTNSTAVRGDVYTSWNGGAAGGGVSYSGYGLEAFDSPFNVLAYLEARSGLHPKVKAQWPLILGELLARNSPLEPDDRHASSTDDIHFSFYSSSHGMPEIPSGNPGDPTFQPTGALFTNGGNSMVGDFEYSYEDNQQLQLAPMVVPTPLDIGDAVPILGDLPSVENKFHGPTRQRRHLAVDPLAGRAGEILQARSFEAVPTLTAADSLLETTYGLTDFAAVKSDRRDGVSPLLLTTDLVLQNGHYEIASSITNRQVIFYEGTEGKGSGLYLRENRVGMQLQNATLLVRGDLDLGATSFEGPNPEDRITVSGAGATIMVTGKLILGNATINAQDQGLVIYADDIVLKGGGTFHGLMIARNSISILSQDDNPLEVQGALLCQGRGGITLRGTKLEHNPEYLKTINGAGDFTVVSWKKL